ncbi:integral membrane protein [Lactiplantibacillus paraplantarum]|uniref:hypothetical protein n=1 Tax=Lactiplantibacillus paraplantarum TaxID=60520 RepID=UPI0003AE0873|nr:hypothetical protein [Lactiplantibacillus paraplantarum]ERL42749.1 integral membrane protein [Lactiplantibacillus paraplantarum]
MENLIKNNSIVLLIIIGLPGLFTWLLTSVNRQTKANLVNHYGINSQVYCGFLGIIIHELSHLVLALIFRHGIQSVRLLKRPHLHPENETADDLALGYVNHTWNRHSLYQVIGNLFIGVAPIFGCTAALLGLDWFLAPGLFQAIFKLADTPGQPQWTASWQALTSTSTSWWQLLLLLILTVTIVIGGFDLSPADYQNSAIGLYSTVGIVLVLTTLLTLIGITNWIHTLVTWGLMVAIILGYSLLVSLVVMLITHLLTNRA